MHTREHAIEIDTHLNRSLSPFYLQRRVQENTQRVFYAPKFSTLVALCDEIFGVDNWNRRDRDAQVDHSTVENDKHQVLSSCIVRVTLANGVFREDVGYGCASDEELSEAKRRSLENAKINGFQRSVRLFGNALGNCLSTAYFEYIEEHLKHELQVSS